MIPREHLPLVLVTLTVMGLVFLLYREINGVKAAVAQLSVPKASPSEEISDDEDDEYDAPENDTALDEETIPETPPKSIQGSKSQQVKTPVPPASKTKLNSSSEKSSTSASTTKSR